MQWQLSVWYCVITVCVAIGIIKIVLAILNYCLKKKEYDYLLTQETLKNKLAEHNYKEKISFSMDKFNSTVENKIKELEELIKKKESNYDSINQKLSMLLTESIIKE